MSGHTVFAGMLAAKIKENKYLNLWECKLPRMRSFSIHAETDN
jgi:hypothetical protein